MIGIKRLGVLKNWSHNSAKILMSTYTESAEFEKKLQHYRNLKALEDKNIKPEGWDSAKPYESLPGPQPLSVVGNMWRFLPIVGNFYGKDAVVVHKELRQQYGDTLILKGVLGTSLVMLFNPKDIEMLFRNEGIWPTRQNFPSMNYYFDLRRKTTSFGLMAHHGEDWFKIRSVVNPILMQPKNILQYADKMNLVADELVDNIEYFAKQNKDGEMPSDFRNELYKWALESIGVVTLDTHLGCLKRDLKPDSEPQKMIYSAIKIFELMFKLDLRPSLWRYFNTPDLKEYIAMLDYMRQTNINHINKALDQLEKQDSDPENETKSVLQQLLRKDRNIAVAMAIDLMLAGIDTTGRVLAAGLYYLAKNTEIQKKLRAEAKTVLATKNTPVTKEALAKAVYLKAVVKEVTRLATIAIGNLRTTAKDLVLGGYQIPKGTEVITSNLILSSMDEHFPRAGEFLPERWLSSAPSDISHKNANPFIFLPFGFGPRSCIGKRLATLELEIALLKIIRNFELQWPHEDMTFATTTLYGIAKPLKIHVKCLDQ